MFTHPGTYLTTGCTLAVGLDAGDLQVEPFHLDFDVHENPGMKKGTLTFERPFQTKSPDSLRRCQRINQNRVPIPVQVAKGYTPW